MIGTFFSIEEFSVYDGPGIRTTVFLKGCPLRCSWCHNPEGQSPKIQIVRSPNGCLSCGECIKNASTQNGKTVFTKESIEKCPMNLLRYCGEETDSTSLCERLLKNQRILASSGGGVTFSGGEPFVQSDFLLECISALKGKLHTAIQTCGYCDSEIFERALAVTDFFLYDLKLARDDMHKKYTGVSNGKILENFSLLAKSGVDFIVRIPLIPGVTDTEENICLLTEILQKNKVSYAELLPYNKMAGGKYKMLLREYAPDFDEGSEVKFREEIFDKQKIKFKIL